MRRDILARKKQSKAAPRPLDDPVILVQNLPDMKPRAPSDGAAATPPVASFASPLPPPPPVEISREEQEVEEEEEVPSPGSSTVERANLEFQRMLLQLQSVVDAPPEDDQEEEEEDEDDEPARAVQPLSSSSSSPPSPPAPYAPPSLKAAPMDMLPVSLLEDVAFKAALRQRVAQLSGTEPKTESAVPKALESQRSLLEWLSTYVHSVVVVAQPHQQ
ncbi:hypothetical protein PINS_up001239 [Pythium insidiosum]|nr:hypothetical protein PINS_up001239 [Pythium insidiosum]